VALAVFALGSGVTVHEGIEKVAHPTPIDHAWVNLVILTISMGLEGFSLSVAIKEVRQEASNVDRTCWTPCGLIVIRRSLRWFMRIRLPSPGCLLPLSALC
jgi:hypothetical protein